MKIHIKTFYELNTTQLYDLLQLRAEVFVVEQDCIYQDIDGKDQKAMHVLGYDGDQLVAYTRVFKPGDYFDMCSIGRVVVSPQHRGKDHGKKIMEASMEYAFAKAEQIKISAQVYLKKFYEDLGFKETGKRYLEDGIPHMEMVASGRNLN
jgi:ElaA protein